MTCFHVEVVCELQADDLETAADTLMDALIEEPGLLDPDFTAELATGRVTIGTGIRSADQPTALRDVLVAVRSAAHKAGAGTPGWEVDMERAMSSVRPMALSTDC